MSRRFAYPVVDNVCARQSCKIEFLAYSLKPYGDGTESPSCKPDRAMSSYDNHEDDFLKYDAFGSICEEGPQAQTTVHGSKVGNLGLTVDLGNPGQCCRDAWSRPATESTT